MSFSVHITMKRLECMCFSVNLNCAQRKRVSTSTIAFWLFYNFDWFVYIMKRRKKKKNDKNINEKDKRNVPISMYAFDMYTWYCMQSHRHWDGFIYCIASKTYETRWIPLVSQFPILQSILILFCASMYK